MGRMVIGLIGVIFVTIGLGTLVDPVTYHPVYGVYINLSNIKWPFAILAISFGIFCLFVSVSKKFMRYCYWICPQCDEVVNLKDNNGGGHHCKKCGTSLEKLEGFYDRK